MGTIVNLRVLLQGCAKFADCKKLQSEHTEEECTQAPSTCTYCCDDDSNCNAFNSAHASKAFPVLCAMAVVISGFVSKRRVLFAV